MYIPLIRLTKPNLDIVVTDIFVVRGKRVGNDTSKILSEYC